ncbi:MAG TPA: hypothetical protein VNB94_03220 [Mycobacteriales bacterium]|nr:hypothetical protein [Mycobacteriales bacterium]
MSQHDDLTSGLTEQGEEGVMTPPHQPVAALDFGTTVEEQLDGEPLDGRLTRELPDPAIEEIDQIETAADVAANPLLNDPTTEETIQ